MAFISHSWKGAEERYYIPDKELLAIVKALKKWKYLLEGAKFPVKIYSDYRNLAWFMKKQELSN